jgi:hypothetical protein
MQSKHRGGIARTHLVLQPRSSSKPPIVQDHHSRPLTRYVSHIRMVFCTLISRINKQFIQRNANCINSTFCASKCADSVAIAVQYFSWIGFADSRRECGRITHYQYAQRALPSAEHSVESLAAQICSCLVFRPVDGTNTRMSPPR